MEQFQIAICEDNIEEQNHLLYLIENSDFPTKITIFNRGEELLKEYKVGKFDLIFMDIYMNGMSGVDAVTSIRKIDENVPVAFTTTSTDHTLESYRLEALKYLEKPVKTKAVHELLELARFKKENTPRLILKIKGKDIFVSFNRILYAEQKSHTLSLFLTGGEVLHANEKLDNIEKQFDGQNFFRCHKSYLVNFFYVKNLDKELMVFTMKEGKNVHIRRESMSKARKAFEAYLFDMTRRMDNE
ncbi:LytR/AlgR family response regulator transcription factor [Inediibacterium massiliense]|uniref:LytR/AlgR family response regulator transcription factor n=1 Tax=Inediibacterium massiliense TaxID=1658111 RepID=UPI0006B60531|nr:LytTR family DNA-binding domain-containing protein [Inediibacterium massiliense]